MTIDDIDWSFPNLSNSGLHAFHWYPATYLAAIPGTLIPHLSNPGDVIMDPFCGSGTSGLESVRLGRRFIGMDTNPVAILVAEAKLSFVSPRNIKESLETVIDECTFGSEKPSKHPNQDELLGWYHTATYSELNSLLCSILRIRNIHTMRTFLGIFSSILKNCSSQGRHWGWVCDNVKPPQSEITYKDAISSFSTAVIEFSKNSDSVFRESQHHSDSKTRTDLRKFSKLFQGDCVSTMGNFASGSIDMIMTSPPYYGVADYVKSQRLSYLWLDKDELTEYALGFKYFSDLRQLEAGARSNRHSSNSHARYLDFMTRFLQESSRLLSNRSPLAMVIGESPYREGTIESLVGIAALEGLRLSHRHKRDIKSTRRRLMARVTDEEVLIFNKA